MPIVKEITIDEYLKELAARQAEDDAKNDPCYFCNRPLCYGCKNSC